MSDADILTALDGWLGDGHKADLRKPEMRNQAQAAQPINCESFVVSGEPLQAASNMTKHDLMVRTVHKIMGRESFAVTKPVTTETAPGATTDTTVSRNDSRASFTQALEARGIPAQSADMLACSLMRRDRQLDDRRSCAECMSFHNGQCLQRITPIGETTIHTLHRCRGFKLSEGFND